jgi:hypothetical protein
MEPCGSFEEVACAGNPSVAWVDLSCLLSDSPFLFIQTDGALRCIRRGSVCGQPFSGLGEPTFRWAISPSCRYLGPLRFTPSSPKPFLLNVFCSPGWAGGGQAGVHTARQRRCNMTSPTVVCCTFITSTRILLWWRTVLRPNALACTKCPSLPLPLPLPPSNVQRLGINLTMSPSCASPSISSRPLLLSAQPQTVFLSLCKRSWKVVSFFLAFFSSCTPPPSPFPSSPTLFPCFLSGLASFEQVRPH